jgi:hypothetical protein
MALTTRGVRPSCHERTLTSRDPRSARCSSWLAAIPHVADAWVTEIRHDAGDAGYGTTQGVMERSQ